MKKSLLVLAFFALTASCGDEPGNGQTPANTLSVAPTTLDFAAGEEGAEFTKAVTVITDAATWDATVAQDGSWISIEKSGSSLDVTATEVNLTATPRRTTIVITAGDADPVTVTVSQQPTEKQTEEPIEYDIEYDTVSAIIYYGDSAGSGTANFVLKLASSITGDGIDIEGFTKLTENGASDFTIAPGRYTITGATDEGAPESTAEGTLLSCYNSTIGTVMNSGDMLTYTAITGGYMDVSVADNGTHTITTDFSGEDYLDDTLLYEHISLRFVGKIDYASLLTDFSNL
ncbi:MAG: hypothetical protein LBV18_01215 [Alistipes sp.]|jgi:hypothetical protein|nr:hypothetical protein [Alistipes sp.]